MYSPILQVQILVLFPCFMSQEQGSRFWNMEFPIYLLFPTLGQEGFNLKDRVDYFCADNPEDFFCYNRTLS